MTERDVKIAELIQQAKAGQEEAIMKLLNEYRNLFRSIIRKYQGTHVEYKDLYQQIYQEFIVLLKEYHPDTGVFFGHYIKKFLCYRVSRHLKELNPISVSDGYTYPEPSILPLQQVVCGNRRAIAARWLNPEKEIQTVVYEGLDFSQRLSLYLAENFCRKDLKSIEIGLICSYLKSNTRMCHEQISGLLKISPKSIQRCLRLLKLSQPVMKALIDGRIEFWDALLLGKVDDAVQSKLADETIKEKLSTWELEQRIKGETKEYYLSIRFSIENWKEELTSKIMEILESITSEDENKT